MSLRPVFQAMTGTGQSRSWSTSLRWILLVMVLAPLALYFSFTSSSRERELQSGSERVRSFAQMFGEQISRSLASLEVLTGDLSQVLATEPEWGTWPEFRGHGLLKARKSRTLPQLRDMAVFDDQGRQRFHTSLTPAPPINVADRSNFLALQNGAERSISGPYLGPDSGLMTLALAHRIGPPDRFAGAVFASIELAYFQAICWSGKYEEQLLAFLLNAEGVIVAECRPAGEVASGVTAIGARLADAYPDVLADIDLKLEQTNVAEKYVVAVRRVDYFPELTVVAALPTSAVLAGWTLDRQRNSLMLGVSLLLMLGGLGYINRQIKKQKRIEADLRRVRFDLERHRNDLELAVQERTKLLSAARDEAQQANLAKDAFLANISHELRTPLNAVIGMAGLALKKSIEPSQRNYLEKIVSAGNHLNRLINDLLDLSKIAAGYMEIESVSFSLRALMANCIALMQVRADEKGVRLAHVIDPVLPDALVGDPLRIEQVLLNLIGNSIKFTAAGMVAIRVRLHQQDERCVCLSIDVEDTGIGMNSKEMNRLFKPFSQADVSISRQFGGTGLGLAISRQLVELMGGDISVSSVEGKGTTFRVLLRLELGDADDLAASATATPEVLPASYVDARVLVVDDQAINREIVDEVLKAVGITAQMAENGQQAVDILLSSGAGVFDLVLMDIQMPVMDGHAATRILRATPGFESLPILAMTAHTMAHQQESSAASGLNGHIGKPFKSADLYQILAIWIPKSKQQCQSLTPAAPVVPVVPVVPALAQEALSASEELPASVRSLAGIPGFDVAAALNRFGGKDARYLHWLRDFVEKSAAVVDGIGADAAAGQAEKAGNDAHAFKGRVGMLGMTELNQQAAALEHALRQGQSHQQLLQALQTSVACACEAIASRLGLIVKKSELEGGKNALEHLVWTAAFSVGVSAMDAQHQKLVSMINRLADCAMTPSNDAAETFHEVLSQMFEYTEFHFKAEERYLRSIEFPGTEQHVAEHAGFVEKLTSFNMSASGGTLDVVGVHEYLKQWLLDHILTSDMLYRKFAEKQP